MTESTTRRPVRKSKSRRGHAAEHEDGERWLLTYSDMITLLMALFMVLFSISSVNISKYDTLAQSLKSAFSGSVLTGGKAILQTGSESTSNSSPNQAEIPAIVPLSPSIAKPGQSATYSQQVSRQLLTQWQQATAEQDELQALARRLNSYSSAHGWQAQVSAVVERRGLVITVLTDKLLFESGSASLQPAGLPLLNEIASLLNLDVDRHPVVVEGYTDSQPISTPEFPSNWELSTDRAAAVVRYLIGVGIPEDRLSAAGYADQFPVASNATAGGRARNRRVQFVLTRINSLPAGSS